MIIGKINLNMIIGKITDGTRQKQSWVNVSSDER